MNQEELNRPLSRPELGVLREFFETTPSAMSPWRADGFLAGVSSAPTMLMPSEWYPLLLGEGTFDSRDEAERITGLLTRRYNEILSSLSRHREDHPAPSLGDEALAEWCRGYIEAARGDSAWMNDEPAVLQLFKFSFLAGEVDLVGEENDKGEVIEDATEYERRYRRGLPAQVLCNHQYWVERRRAEYVPSEPAVTSKVGRNDPCPCGSGRKYKRCCLG